MGLHSAEFACSICHRSFQSKSSWYAHRGTHAGQTTCPVCGKFLSRLADVRRHMNLQHNLARDAVTPDFRCGRCAAAFRSYESLLHHHKTHEGLTRCPLCDTCLNRVSDLRRHMGRVHKLERPQPRRTLDMLQQYTERATQALETGSIYRQVFWNW
ncbi:zinc finger protein 768-like [Pollicipes pollicipes]|nr:zinc finger protein 768-like [Pollicipes pollicipes]